MEQPHDPFHVRPFPQQPHRGGKELLATLKDLEMALMEDIPDFERLRTIQKRIHETGNTFNDDRLIDKLRQISNGLDGFLASPSRDQRDKIAENILKAFVDLKYL